MRRIMIGLFLLLTLIGCDPPKSSPLAFYVGDPVVLIGGIEGMVIDYGARSDTFYVRYVNKDGTLSHDVFKEYELRKVKQ